MNRLLRTTASLLECPPPAAGPVHNAQCRRQYHAEHRLAIFDQGDIDRELVIALDELLGAIERIDQPQTRPGATFFIADGGRLLRQHRDIRRQRPQPRADERMGGAVGFGQR